MNVRRPTALALAACWLAVPAAQATTAPVTTTRLATASLELAAPDGTSVQLEIRLQDGVDADLVRVQRVDCTDAGCTAPDFFEGVVDGSAVSLDRDAAAGTAALVLAGRSLDLAWSPDPQSGAVVGGVEGGGNDASTVFGSYLAEPAVAEVVLEGTPCSDADAAVGDGVRVAVPEDGHGGARPLAELRLDGAEQVCAAAAS